MGSNEFGPFHYDPEQRLLFRSGEVVSLAPKAIDTLHFLLERRGRVVEKAELMKLLWPDTAVEEIGLARNISILRKALEEGGDGAQFIETVPKRGYRFVAEPVAAHPVPQPHRVQRIALIVAVGALVSAGFIYWQFYVPSKYLVHKPGVASLAVVPFESLTSDRTFARGVTDQLVADLANRKGIEVLSPSTVRRHQYVGVSMGLMGRLLGLDALVEGSVEQSGGQAQVSARLVDVHTGKIIWASNYSRSTESEAARNIADQIGVQLAAVSR